MTRADSTTLSHSAALPEDPAPSGEALCARCAARGTSCCATEPALGHLSFPLSLPEWRRLLRWRHPASEAADAGGPALFEEAPPKEGDACCQPWDNTPEFIASMRALFPNERERIERLFPEGGRHFALRLREDGACVFLGERGCDLPRQVRPWYCLLFPIWFTVGGAGLFAAEGCLIAESARSRAHAVSLLGVSLDSLRDIFARLREDWGLEQEPEDFHEKI